MKNYKKGAKPIDDKGKTKVIWPVEGDKALIIMEAKDTTTADNDASKTKIISSKGACSTITTSKMFELLEEAGIPTAYVKKLSDNEILAKSCKMIPLEVIIRRYAVGSYLQRMPQLKKEGIPYRFDTLKFELFLKTSGGLLGDFDLRDHLPESKEELIEYLDKAKALKSIQKTQPELKKLEDAQVDDLVKEVIKIIDDPWFDMDNQYFEDAENYRIVPLKHPKKPTWEIDTLVEFNFHNIEAIADLSKIEDLTRRTFLLLENAWAQVGYKLIDFKIEFGIDSEGNLVIADVIDNDSWRLRTEDWKELSKQNFRDGHPLKDVQENYIHVAKMTEELVVPEMPKIAIIMGSTSDWKYVKPVADGLKERGYPLHLRALSAHRTPEDVKEFVKWCEENGIKVILAAAGLAAALPGVVASLTQIPVIGVALDAGGFGGLDAILAIAQMPPGVPALCVFTNDTEYGPDATYANMIANTAVLALKQFKGINIIVGKGISGVEHRRVVAATSMLEKFKMEFQLGDVSDPDCINIQFVVLDEGWLCNNEDLTINCCLSDTTTEDDAYMMLQISEDVPIVGLNRGENAALMALKFLAMNNKDLAGELQQFKEDQAVAVLEKEAGMKEEWSKYM